MSLKRALIVQQDSGVTRLIAKILESPNLECVLAHNYDSVELILENQTFDFVITDIVIDGVFTNEYIEFLNEKLPDSPIIIMTKMRQKSTKIEIETLGIEAYITLPIEVEDLKLRLKQYL